MNSFIISKKASERYIFIICLILLFTPIVLGRGYYYMGGDDTRLYYLFPEGFLKNYVFNIASNNTLAGAISGYSSVAYFAPFIVFLLLVKTFLGFINIQLLLYGLNLSLGFLFMYKMLDLFSKKEEKNYVLKIVVSLFYLFSQFLINTHFTNQLISIYSVSIIPSVMFFFIKGINKDKLNYSVAAVLIYSLFSTTINSLPYYLSFFICSLPLFIYILIKRKKVFIRHVVIGTVVFLIINSYWLFHFVNSGLPNGGTPSIAQQFSTQEFINENKRIATGVTGLFSPINQLFNQMQMGSLKTRIPHIVFYLTPILLICTAGILIKKKNRYYDLFFISLSSLLLSWYFFSPNFGTSGAKIFVKMVETVPFWGMFRNMFDKFSLSLSFYYSLTLYFSILIIFSKIKSDRLKRIVLVLLSIPVFINVVSYVRLWSSDNIKKMRFSGNFSDDFVELTSYINEMDRGSRYLWMPLSAPNYLNIADEKYEQYSYTGLSPMQVMTGKSDIAGRFGFMEPTNIFLGDRVFNTILPEKKYDEMGQILMQTSTNYIIVDNHTIPDNWKDLFYGNDRSIYNTQVDYWYQELLGEKVQDFGSSYSLYKINPKYLRQKFCFVQGDEDGINNCTAVDYEEVSSEMYDVNGFYNQSGKLIMMEPYSKNWIMTSSINVAIKSMPYMDYYNSWEVGNNLPEETNNMKIIFTPAKYNIYLYSLSTLSFITTLIYVLKSSKIKL